MGLWQQTATWYTGWKIELQAWASNLQRKIKLNWLKTLPFGGCHVLLPTSMGNCVPCVHYCKRPFKLYSDCTCCCANSFHITITWINLPFSSHMQMISPPKFATSSFMFLHCISICSCTPLHMSAGHRSKLEVSFLLVEHGARIYENNIHGVRPVDLEPVWFSPNAVMFYSWCWVWWGSVGGSGDHSCLSPSGWLVNNFGHCRVWLRLRIVILIWWNQVTFILWSDTNSPEIEWLMNSPLKSKK